MLSPYPLNTQTILYQPFRRYLAQAIHSKLFMHYMIDSKALA
jgi:hypothetical protein